MGQNISSEVVKGDPDQLVENFQAIKGEVVQQSKQILAAAVCDYDEFIERINELNAL